MDTSAAATLDCTRPVAIMMLAILYDIPDLAEALLVGRVGLESTTGGL